MNCCRKLKVFAGTFSSTPAHFASIHDFPGSIARTFSFSLSHIQMSLPICAFFLPPRNSTNSYNTLNFASRLRIAQEPATCFPASKKILFLDSSVYQAISCQLGLCWREGRIYAWALFWWIIDYYQLGTNYHRILSVG